MGRWDRGEKRKRGDGGTGTGNWEDGETGTEKGEGGRKDEKKQGTWEEGTIWIMREKRRGERALEGRGRERERDNL